MIMKIFITGSASSLGAALLPILCEDPAVMQVSGIDVKPTEFKHPKLPTEILDIRDPNLSKKMVGFDAVIHLAFLIAQEGRTLNEMHDVNVLGGMLVVDASIKSCIKKFINLSSTSVYGSGENIIEDSPLNPLPKYPYAQHKAELENYIDKRLPRAIQLRSQVIIGRNSLLFLRAMLKSPVYIYFGKRQLPKQQLIHEKDITQAIILSLKKDVSGKFNLAAPEIIDITGSYIKAGRSIPPFPLYFVRYLARIAKFINPNGDYTLFEILDTNLTVNCTRAKALLGWEPRYSIWEARNDAIASFKLPPTCLT